MNILIIGGGHTAANLIKLALADRSREARINVVEINHAASERLADQFPIKVFNGDGTNIDILKMANCAKADVFLALTGKDEDNLVACQIAHNVFKIRSPICRVTNPKNIGSIQQLGIYNTFSSSVLLAKVLNQEIENSGLYIVYDIPGNSKAIVEFSLRPDAGVCGKELKDCTFPGESRIVLVTRGSDAKTSLASGKTVLQPHDLVMMVCDFDDFDAIQSDLVETEVPEALAEQRALLEQRHEEELGLRG